LVAHLILTIVCGKGAGSGSRKIPNVLLIMGAVVRVDPSLRLSLRCGIAVFDDLSNGPFRRSLSAVRKNMTC
jgi:hypothetical protein